VGQLDDEHWVVKENIARFEYRLKQETDPDQRQMLTELLAREQAKLQEKRSD
jgi:hypothetical protein